MPCLGRVPSPGWKRACNSISHPVMRQVGWGDGAHRSETWHKAVVSDEAATFLKLIS